MAAVLVCFPHKEAVDLFIANHQDSLLTVKLAS